MKSGAARLGDVTNAGYGGRHDHEAVAHTLPHERFGEDDPVLHGGARIEGNPSQQKRTRLGIVFLKATGSEELVEIRHYPANGPVQVQSDLTHLSFEVDDWKAV